MNDELGSRLQQHLRWGNLEGEERLRFLALALAGEAGELCDVIKKQWRDGHDRRDLLVDELADVANYTLARPLPVRAIPQFQSV